MSYEVDYLSVAAATGANVDSQANFQGSGYQQTGFQVGIAQPYQVNKILRQTSMMAAALANVISNVLNIAVIDDGNLATLITNLTNAIKQLAETAQARGVSMTYSATPIFDASQGNVFEMVLTGDVTNSTIINTVPWQSITFIIRQDGTGGHAFAAPSGFNVPAINPAASSASAQTFILDSASNPFVTSPLMS